MLFAGVQLAPQTQSAATCGQFEVQACDLDGDGSISILDLTLMAQHFTERVGTPFPCVPGAQHFATPQLVYDAQGTPIAAVVNRIAVPTDDPRYLPNLQGTPVRLVPC